MIPMENWATKAVDKINRERKNVTGQKEKLMAGEVFNVIKDFCLQDEEFAQAVVQGGNFADCMKQVAADVGDSISDLEAYKKAVQFYFPDAEIQMQMSIDLVGAAAEPEHVREKVCRKHDNGKMFLNLEDFFV